MSNNNKTNKRIRLKSRIRKAGAYHNRESATNAFRKKLRHLFIASVVALSVLAIGWAGVAGTAVAQEEPDAIYNVTEIEADDTVAIGDDFEIEGTITNNGNTAGDQYVSIRLSGPGDEDFVAESFENVTLEPGESETFTVSLDTSSFEETGDGLGAVHTEDEEVGTEVLVTQDENFFEVSNLNPGNTTIAQGEELDASAQVTNTGDIDADQDIELEIDGTVVETQNVTLDSDEDETVTFENVSTAALEPGTYEYGVASEDDNMTATLTVEPGVATYANDDGIVESSGVFDAIADWRADEIESDLVFEVIDAWRVGDAVV